MSSKLNKTEENENNTNTDVTDEEEIEESGMILASKRIPTFIYCVDLRHLLSILRLRLSHNQTPHRVKHTLDTSAPKRGRPKKVIPQSKTFTNINRYFSSSHPASSAPTTS